MSDAAQRIYVGIGLLIILLFASGTWGVMSNSDSAAYLAANKETVMATVIGTSGDSHVCVVDLDQSGATVRVSTPPLAGACDDNSPLKSGTRVQIEYWNGKPTAIYDDQLSWPSLDNPGHQAALASTALFFGILIFFPAALVFCMHYIVARSRGTRR